MGGFSFLILSFPFFLFLFLFFCCLTNTFDPNPVPAGFFFA